MPPESFPRYPVSGINRAIRPHVNCGFKWRKVFVLTDFGFLLVAGPEIAKSGVELGGWLSGEVRNLSREPAHQVIKNPSGDPLGF